MAHALPATAARPLVVGLIVLWGLFGFAFPSAQQSRLVRLDPRLASITLSLNGSAIYAGVSLGALFGSVVVSRGHLTSLGWVAALCELGALATLALAPAVARAPAVQPVVVASLGRAD